MNNTYLYYKNCNGDLRTLSYGNDDYNIDCVNDQGSVVQEIIDLGLPIPFSPVLCLIKGGLHK